MEIDNFKVIGDRVVIKQLDAENKTKSGLFIPDSVKEKPSRGTIMCITNELDYKKGDTIVFARHSGTTIILDEEVYIIMQIKDLFGILN